MKSMTCPWSCMTSMPLMCTTTCGGLVYIMVARLQKTSHINVGERKGKVFKVIADSCKIIRRFTLLCSGVPAEFFVLRYCRKTTHKSLTRREC